MRGAMNNWTKEPLLAMLAEWHVMSVDHFGPARNIKAPIRSIDMTTLPDIRGPLRMNPGFGSCSATCKSNFSLILWNIWTIGLAQKCTFFLIHGHQMLYLWVWWSPDFSSRATMRSILVVSSETSWTMKDLWQLWWFFNFSVCLIQPQLYFVCSASYQKLAFISKHRCTVS